MIRTAILIDGGFYRRRVKHLSGDKTPKLRADELFAYALRLLHSLKHGNSSEDCCFLYRVFYYDCPPLDTSIWHPSLKKNVNLKKTDVYTWTNEFFNELKKKRKVALRLGKLSQITAEYRIRKRQLAEILSGSLQISDLKEGDFQFCVEQKGVDMRIGIDIASLAYKKLVDRIILVSGDSDFVPIAKLARREGIDFVLDPMGAENITADLYEHVDGVLSCSNKHFKKEGDVAIEDNEEEGEF